jgi:hypothetical protein
LWGCWWCTNDNHTNKSWSLAVTPLYCKHQYRYTKSLVDLFELVEVVVEVVFGRPARRHCI